VPCSRASNAHGYRILPVRLGGRRPMRLYLRWLRRDLGSRLSARSQRGCEGARTRKTHASNSKGAPRGTRYGSTISGCEVALPTEAMAFREGINTSKTVREVSQRDSLSRRSTSVHKSLAVLLLYA